MMKNKIHIVVAWIIAIFVMFFSFVASLQYVVLPTNSSQNMLTLSSDGYISPSRITIKHYVNNIHVCDYTLDLSIELRHQTFQKYKLPQLNEGRVEVCIELVGEQGYIKTNFIKAKVLYEKGILIYFSSDNRDINRYVYFISGRNKNIYYNKYDENGVFKWFPVQKAPNPRKIIRKEISYSYGSYGWEENSWVIDKK